MKISDCFSNHQSGKDPAEEDKSVLMGLCSAHVCEQRGQRGGGHASLTLQPRTQPRSGGKPPCERGHRAQ